MKGRLSLICHGPTISNREGRFPADEPLEERAAHGGETLLSVFERVGGWLDARLGDSGHAVVVTHATVVRAALLHILGAPTQAFWRMDVEPFSITEMTTDGERWQLRLTNAVR